MRCAPSAGASTLSALSRSSGQVKAVPKMNKHLAVAATVALAGVLAAPGIAAAGTDPSWAIQSTPNPSGGVDTNMFGVSCPSATACTAVGFSENKSGVALALAEHWNGRKWAIQSTRKPSGAEDSYLAGVSCSSRTACTAAGDSERSSGVDVTLAEHWNGKKWVIQSTPNPSRAKDSDPLAVSCSSGRACTAVGEYEKHSGVVVTLALHWNGRKWTLQSTPNPSGAQSSVLAAVSCSSGTACTAAGAYQNHSGLWVTLAERWNGRKWVIQSSPNPSGAEDSFLYGVSCSSRTACTAAGYYQNSSGVDLTLAEHWNGKKWVIQSTPNPSGAETSEFAAVSCSSGTACTAAGYYKNSSGVDVTLAEYWNGKKWVIQSTPNPSGAETSELAGVSRVSGKAITAVGYYENGTGVELTLAERHS